MPTDDYEVDGPDPDLTLWCPNPACPQTFWGAFVSHEYDTNAHWIDDGLLYCDTCGTEGVEQDPGKEEIKS